MSDVKIVPLGKRVLVQPAEAEDKTPGGLLIPPTAQDDSRPERGTVLKVGDKVKNKDLVGKVVFFKSYSTTELEVGDDKYLVISSKDILAVLD